MSTVDTATTSLAPMIVQEPLASTSRAPPPITQSTDVPELNVPQLVKEQLKLSSGSEMDNSGHAEGRLDDGEGRREGYGPSSTSDNVAESDVTMTGGHSLLSQTQDGLDISMLIDGMYFSTKLRIIQMLISPYQRAFPYTLYKL